MGPVIIAENVGAIRSVDSSEEPGACGDAGGMASAPDDVGTSCACSNVASGTTPAALLGAIDAAIAALDAGETDVARAQLRGLIAAIGHTPGSRPNLSERDRLFQSGAGCNLLARR
jgi:hypothetical protein